MSLETKIPELAKARETEARIREQGFLQVPVMIAGVESMPLTARHLLLLGGMGSPFVCGGLPVPSDVAGYLWVTSPHFTGRNGWIDRWHRSAMLRKIRKASYINTVAAIRDRIDEAFMDAPCGSGSNGEQIASTTAYLVHSIASKYHWHRDEILDTPLAELWQYIRINRKIDDPDAMIVNRHSARVIGDYLVKVNEGKSRPETNN